MKQFLRIAVFVHEFPALSETFVLNQITGLLQLGCDVRIFAIAPRPEAFRHHDVERYGLLRRTSYLGMPKNRLRRLWEGGRLAVRHIRARPRQALRALDPFRYGREALSLKLLFWLDRLAGAESRFDVLYCHFGTIGLTTARLREIGAVEGALATAFHGVDVSASLRGRPNLYDGLFAAGEMFLPASRHFQRRLQAHGCDPGRTAVHHMGVDLSRFRYRRRIPDPRGVVRLLTVGRLVEKKGVVYGLRAMAAACERGLNLHYTIVGDGPLRPYLEALAGELGLAGAVAFVGWRTQDRIVAHMYESDILLAPSVTDRSGDQEAIPVVLTEAMATGMAVISTRHGGIPELVVDGTSGLLAEEGDVDGLATAIELLAADPQLRERMGRNARAALAKGFDLRDLNARLLRLFEELAADADGAAAERTVGGTVLARREPTADDRFHVVDGDGANGGR